MNKALTLAKPYLFDALKTGGKIALATLLMALIAQVKIPLYFTPVPLTLQTLAAMLIGIWLGPRAGALSITCYLAMGAAGLPVLAGGAVNPALIVGTRGGYLVGMVLQAALSGWIAKKGFSWMMTTLFLALTALLQLGMGALWLGTFVGFNNALPMGVLPFLVGEFIKVVIAAAIVHKVSLKRAACKQ